MMRMRTTITLDDVVAAIERLRREERIGVSEAANRLIRAGLVAHRPHRRYEHRRSHRTQDRRRRHQRSARSPGRIVMLVDANLLLYAVDASSSHHAAAANG